jgi:hypothetical protein
LLLFWLKAAVLALHAANLRVKVAGHDEPAIATFISSCPWPGRNPLSPCIPIHLSSKKPIIGSGAACWWDRPHGFFAKDSSRGGYYWRHGRARNLSMSISLRLTVPTAVVFGKGKASSPCGLGA